MQVNVPVPFPGTAEERAANRATHFFGGIDGRCFDCDSRPTHVAADYPCCVEPPRMWITR
jgi:hypothetical protein